MVSVRSVLSFPLAYETFWNAVGGPGYIKTFVKEYVRPMRGARILDIGCGPGTVVPYLTDVEYFGIDISSAYIASAQRRFPQAHFVCERVGRWTVPQTSHFNVVLALGILHHLDDAEARALCEIAHAALKPGGKLVTFDGVFTADQSFLARCLIRMDRGKFVRKEKDYVQIASQVFANIQSTVRHDLLRIPYSHLIMECSR